MKSNDLPREAAVNQNLLVNNLPQCFPYAPSDTDFKIRKVLIKNNIVIFYIKMGRRPMLGGQDDFFLKPMSISKLIVHIGPL